jgi:small conductance mechanosensitive channel
MEMLKQIAMDIRNSDDFKALFIADPQVLGVDAVRGSELIFPVVFKTKATQQYAPVREFKRRVRIALEENQLLPGDPYRVYSGVADSKTSPPAPGTEPTKHDPTTIKPQESNPFGGS